jgi:hypothetical protein
MRSLKIGQSAYVLVRAEAMWNSSDILVRKGEHYRFRARNVWYWYDNDIESTPDGQIDKPWVLRALPAVIKRCDSAEWYALVGCVGKKTRNQFLIGSGCNDAEMPADGELLFFANDVRTHYSNNHGQLRLDIERIG